MTVDTTVIKRQGQRHSELFDPEKLLNSVQAACLSARAPVGEAEVIARHVVRAVTNWCADKSAITSNDLRRIATGGLEIFHPEAAYLYKNHRLVI